jgi:mono/diheme cytochrome c family protein
MSRHPLAILVLIECLSLLAAVSAMGEEGSSLDPAQVEFFEKSIRPVLAANCFSCHGPTRQKAGLRLDARAAMLKGGDSGPAVQPGRPDASLLVQAVHYGEERQMPPKGKLKEADIAALTAWVKAGAVWPEVERGTRAEPPTASDSPVTARDRAFWSFQPIQAPPIPEVRAKSWPKTPIDRFILAELEAKGLRPVGPADKRALIRRATFDLVGLPPTVEEVDAFLSDASPDAFARVVDRLLAAPEYGERWGRHWLDVARYGEDQAHTFQARLYPYGYRYRDWVVQAFNADMPYDRFVTEQLAADRLDGPDRDRRLAALGLFALGPVYYGKATADELDDRIDTLCRGVLGLTVACARCHDHKFDPIPTSDYYALAGVFSSTAYKEYPHAPTEEVEAYDRAQAAIQAQTVALAAALKEESARLSESLMSRTAEYMVAAWTLANRRKRNAQLASDEVAEPARLQPVLLDRWVRYLFPSGADRRPHLARWRRLLAGQDPAVDLSAAAAARAEAGRVAQAFQDYVRSLQRLRDAAAEYQAAAAANSEGSSGAAPAPTRLALGEAEAAVLREIVSDTGLFAVPRDKVEAWLPADAKARLKGRRAQLARLKETAPPRYPVTHALTEAATIANMRIHLRGNPRTLGADVPRHFLTILAGDRPPPFTQGSGRLELARAIASRDNPLTARVLVNRVWEHHFGKGLVATPSNFGTLGERPTHPLLLDHLASRFLEQRWSIKALHRTIMLSAVYQLGCDVDASNHAVDPDNTRLWRMNRRRIEVEAWRDAMLAVSGRLDRSMGGPSLDLATPANRRRTLYAAISRHQLNGLLRLFDFPDPNITCDKRTVTTVPLQQLFVLNSDFIERQAEALAARLTARANEDDAARIRRAFLDLFSRPATDQEVSLGLEFLAGATVESPGGPQARPAAPTRWEQYAQVLLGSNEFAFLD